MIYKDGNTLKAYKGDYAPVNIYRGGNKIAGWRFDEKTGASLSFNNTYNDFVDRLEVEGKSIQDGTPTPTTPIEIQSVNNFNLNTYGENLANVNDLGIEQIGLPGQKYISDFLPIQLLPLTVKADVDTTYPVQVRAHYYDKNKNLLSAYTMISLSTANGRCITFPSVTDTEIAYMRFTAYSIIGASIPCNFNNIQLVRGTYTAETMPTYKPYTKNTIPISQTLRSLPSGVCDKLVGDKLTQSAWIERNISEIILTGNETGTYNEGNSFASVTVETNAPLGYAPQLCTHNTNGQLYFNPTYIRFYRSRWGFTSFAELKTFLTTEYNKGTPLTVQYQLVTPTIEPIPYQDIYTVYGTTIITTDSSLLPNITAKVKIIDT